MLLVFFHYQLLLLLYLHHPPPHHLNSKPENILTPKPQFGRLWPSHFPDKEIEDRVEACANTS